MDQPLDRFREIGHRGGGSPMRAAVGDCLAQTLDRQLQVARHGGGERGNSRRLALDAEIAHRGGEPILELGIEAVLRLTRLQIEKAEHQRPRQSEQRG